MQTHTHRPKQHFLLELSDMLTLKLPPDSSKQDTHFELSFQHWSPIYATNARLGALPRNKVTKIKGLYPGCQLTSRANSRRPTEDGVLQMEIL